MFQLEQLKCLENVLCAHHFIFCTCKYLYIFIYQLFHSTFDLKVFHCRITVWVAFFLSDSSKDEVRCYCNQPYCVSQSYMCRGIRCLTKIPTSVSLPLLRAGFDSDCVKKNENNSRIVANNYCPHDAFCCDKDLCNHEDSPAMKNILNKILRKGLTVFSSLFAFPVLQHSGRRIYHVSIIAI